MMKNTYLVYKQVNGVRQLVAATPQEWNEILKENRKLPSECRRRFVKDCFEDEGELDCMYIEVSVPEHKKWNSKNTIRQKKRKFGTPYTLQSMDAELPDSEVDSLHECVPADFNLEQLVTDHILLEELKKALRMWSPWAEELLEFYLLGDKRNCTKILCEKYHLTYRAVQKRKAAFEKFILNFLKK